jgi:protein-disulfide isomerase
MQTAVLGNKAPKLQFKSFKKQIAKLLDLKALRFLKNFSLTYILIIMLVGAAYYIGSMRTEIAYLKKASPTVPSQAGLNAPPPAEDPTGPVPELTDQDHVRGDRDADVLLIEYSDLECPYCKRFHPTMQQVIKDYGDKVAWAYRHFPLNFHANAQKEAEASECVAEFGGEDKFWEYVDKIFEMTTSNGTGFALDKLGPLAAEIGVDQGSFQECLDSGKYAQLVKDQMNAGGKAGVKGTPGTFVISKDGFSKQIPGALPIDQVKQTIDEALK